jgi:hypothetical protein
MTWEADEDDPKPQTWKVIATRTLTGVLTLDAHGYGITTVEEAKREATSQMEESDSGVEWEYSGFTIDKCFPVGAHCKRRDPSASLDWCTVHDAGYSRNGKNCWERVDEVRARWHDRQEERGRKAFFEFARTHHHTEWAPEREVVPVEHRWKCKDCDAKGTDRESRAAHGQVAL